MALKNHALDDKILQAAREEFLSNGYEAASLRKIASAAGVTIGAIYTRYPTKDALFCALVQPLIDQISVAFSSIRCSYYQDCPNLRPEHMAEAMHTESQEILHLLFDNYDRAVLLLCKSIGSSLESFFDGIIDQKLKETIVFFQSAGIPHPDDQVLRLLVSGQFHMYVQIIRGGYDLASARKLMHAAMIYHTGGWLSLLNSQQDFEMEDQK